jgi:ParB-like chromosome segregation protein Spo0J
LVENLQRQDLSPIEEARAYQARLAEGTTQAELGRRIGKGQSYVSQKLRLLNLPDVVQEALAAGELLEGHARQLLRLQDAAKQGELCRQAVAESWTVARMRAAVDRTLAPATWILQEFERAGGIPDHSEPWPEEREPGEYDPPREVRALPIDQIVDDPELDYRVERDPEYAERLADVFITLPPIAVFDVEGEYLLADGRYRVLAAQRLELQEIECRIYEGKSRLDAFDYGVAVNARHGWPATEAETRAGLAQTQQAER